MPIYIAKVMTAEPITVGALELCPAKLEARMGGHEIRLSGAEYAVLLCLARNGEQVTTESEIRLFLAPVVVSVRELVSDLRRKMREVNPQVEIVNIYGVGYRLQVP